MKRAMTPSFFSHCRISYDNSINSHHVDGGGGGAGGGSNAVSGCVSCGTVGEHSSGDSASNWNGQCGSNLGSDWDTDDWGGGGISDSGDFGESSAARSGGGAYGGSGSGAARGEVSN